MDTLRKQQDTKTMIEDAALDLFCSRPYSSVTMDDIAKQAGFSKRAVYNHFPSKADIILRIFAHRLESLEERNRSALLCCGSAKEVLYAHLGVLNQFTRENFRSTQLFWNVNEFLKQEEFSEESLAAVSVINKRIIDYTAQKIRSFERTGILAMYEPEMLIHLISAVNKGVFLHQSKEQGYNISSPSLDFLLSMSNEMIRTFIESV